MPSALDKSFRKTSEKSDRVMHVPVLVKFVHTDEGAVLAYSVPVKFQTCGLNHSLWKAIQTQVAKLCSACKVPWALELPQPGCQSLSNSPAHHFSSVFPQLRPLSHPTASSSLSHLPTLLT